MELGIIGLGRMGGNMARRLLRGGHRVVVHDRTLQKVRELEQEEGAVGAGSPEALAQALSPPRIVWIMVPAGDPVDAVIRELLPHLQSGDLVVDGGNSFFKDSQRRSRELGEHGIAFLDAGVSGGIWGLEKGYCIMVGGDPEAYRRLEPALRTLAAPGGYRRVGPSGAGHYVKMVHNGIEYGLMQAYAEGFEVLHTAPFALDLAEIAALWNQGSVVRSWLLELAEEIFRQNPHLESIRGYVEDSGEGRWTVQTAMEQDVPVPVISLSLQARLRSRQEESFGAKVLAALRHKFGGHPVKTR